MPRVARQKSKSGIYHIMVRGENRQEIMHDDEDNIRFLETLVKYKEKSDMKVYPSKPCQSRTSEKGL